MKKVLAVIIMLSLLCLSACGVTEQSGTPSVSGDASGDADPDQIVASNDYVEYTDGDVTGNADNKSVRSISLKTDSEFSVYQYSQGYYLDNDTFYYDLSRIVKFNEGDILKVETDEGVKDYRYELYYPYGNSYCYWAFVNGNDAIHVNVYSLPRELEFPSFGQSAAAIGYYRSKTEEWTEPGKYKAYIEYDGISTPIEVELLENSNVESISFEVVNDLKTSVTIDLDGNKVNKYESIPEYLIEPGMQYDEDEHLWYTIVGPENCDWTREIRKPGNKLHAYYKDGTENIYTYITDYESGKIGFYDEEGKIEVCVEARVDSSQWTEGSDNTVKILAFGLTCEVPLQVEYRQVKVVVID